MEEKKLPVPALETGDKTILNFTDPNKFDRIWRLAQMLARNELMPKAFKGKPENCLLAIDLSLRLRIGIFETAQQMHVIYGRPTMSAAWQVSQLEQSGLIRGEVDYIWSGEESRETLACYAVAVRASDGKKVRGETVSYKMAEKRGWTNRPDHKTGKNTSWWPDAPRHMCMKRAGTWLISAYFSRVTMGFMDTESARDITPERPTSPYAPRDREAPQDADWHEIPSEAEPSPEAPLPESSEPVGNPAERAASIAAKDWAEAKGREHSASEPVVATFGPCAAVVVDEVGADELKNMDLE